MNIFIKARHNEMLNKNVSSLKQMLILLTAVSPTSGIVTVTQATLHRYFLSKYTGSGNEKEGTDLRAILEIKGRNLLANLF